MARNHYTNTAPETSIVRDINASAAAMEVDNATGYPEAPFYVILEADTTSEEIVLVTSKAGNVFSIDRGIGDDGSAGGAAAFSHSSGATVKHGATASDFNNMALVFEAMDDGAGGVNPPLVKPIGGSKELATVDSAALE